MKRFWASWWSGNYEDEGCTIPPFKFWVSGQKCRPKHGLTDEQFVTYKHLEDEDDIENFLAENGKDDCSICAVIDAENIDAVWELVATHFPDYEERFCEEKPLDFTPGDRFR